MKHRGSSKVKYEHHIINGLRATLEEIAEWPEIVSLIPGEIKPRKGSAPFILSVQYETATGLKCIAKSGGAVQEVFVVTNDKLGVAARLKQYAAK